jgi:hypothetical protein
MTRRGSLTTVASPGLAADERANPQFTDDERQSRCRRAGSKLSRPSGSPKDAGEFSIDVPARQRVRQIDQRTLAAVTFEKKAAQPLHRGFEPLRLGSQVFDVLVFFFALPFPHVGKTFAENVDRFT